MVALIVLTLNLKSMEEFSARCVLSRPCYPIIQKVGGRLTSRPCHVRVFTSLERESKGLNFWDVRISRSTASQIYRRFSPHPFKDDEANHGSQSIPSREEGGYSDTASNMIQLKTILSCIDNTVSPTLAYVCCIPLFLFRLLLNLLSAGSSARGMRPRPQWVETSLLGGQNSLRGSTCTASDSSTRSP